MRKFVLAIDQGTTSSKALIINHEGEILGQSGYEFKQYYRKPGWVEHDPVEIWESLKTACRDVIARTDIRPSEIEAIGITNQQ